jgi:hypothetical protein
MQRQLEKLLTSHIRNSKAYLTLLLISGLFVAPILFAGVDYIDDTSRKLEGAYQWGSLGRIITEALMHTLTFNFGSMTDPGNLMQVLCIPILALTAYVLARTVSDGRNLTVSDVFIGAQIIPNQLLLTNLSFRFDSLSMILANLVAVYAAHILLQNSKHRTISWIIVPLLIFVAAGLYQSSVLMFAVTIIVAMVIHYVSRPNEKFYPTLLKAMTVFIAGSLLYIGMLKVFHFRGIAGARKELVPFGEDGVHIILHNFKAGLKTTTLFISNAEALVIAMLVAIAFFVSLVFILFQYAKKRNRIDTIAIILSPVLIVLTIMGPFVLMLASNLTTQVRVLTSVIGVMLLSTVMIVLLYKSGRRWGVWLLVAPLLMGLYSINFAYTYGSTLKAQRSFDETVYNSIAATIESSPQLRTSHTIFVGGEPASPQTVLTQFSKRPALKRMNVAGDNSRWYIWMRLKDEGIGDKIELYSGKHDSKNASTAVCSAESKSTIIENELYTVYRVRDGVYILWLQDPMKKTTDLCSQV